MNKKQILGSKTAKDGFLNEDNIINKFNNWQNDKDAQEWLIIMQYKLNEIKSVNAFKIKGNYKSDIQAQIIIELTNLIDCQNIQIKLVNNLNGFNQIDKRKIDKYIEMWNIPENISNILKKYTGKIKPNI